MQEEKTGLNIDGWFSPIANIQTSIGELFLLPLLVSDIENYKSISDDGPVNRIRRFLPRIASLSPDNVFNKERETISDEHVEKLSDDDIDIIADAYVVNEKELKNLSNNNGESAASFLDRCMQKKIKEHETLSKKSMEKALGAFYQVQKSRNVLGKSLDQFKNLSNKTQIFSLPENTHDDFNKQMIKDQNERSIDREMVRLSGKMAEQSAELLYALSCSASKLLGDFDTRDKSSKKTTRKKLIIAIGAVIVSALLSYGSLVQDYKNNMSGSQWKNSLLPELKVSNQHCSASENEVKRLNGEILKLKHQVIGLDNQRRAVKNKRVSSASKHSKP
jgi:hypothetical protein